MEYFSIYLWSNFCIYLYENEGHRLWFNLFIFFALWRVDNNVNEKKKQENMILATDKYFSVLFIYI